MIERCLELRLVDTKHCDDATGFQQYVKISPVYSDYKAYKVSMAAKNGRQETILVSGEKGWWTKDGQGNYPPDGPSSEVVQQYEPIIEHFRNGILVKDRLDRSGGLTIGRL
jgi:hypothetical protein